MDSAPASHTMSIRPGDFTQFDFPSSQVTMLDDAYKAVSSVPGGWDYLARPDVPEGGSFMFGPETPTLKAINSALTFTGHSGGTYGVTIRAMEWIAKKGWESYVASCRPARTAREFIQTLPPNTLPNQTEQVKTFEGFLDGKLSYAEMRSRIG
jgi:hypothetical protein